MEIVLGGRKIQERARGKRGAGGEGGKEKYKFIQLDKDYNTQCNTLLQMELSGYEIYVRSEETCT